MELVGGCLAGEWIDRQEGGRGTGIEDTEKKGKIDGQGREENGGVGHEDAKRIQHQYLHSSSISLFRSQTRGIQKVNSNSRKGENGSKVQIYLLFCYLVSTINHFSPPRHYHHVNSSAQEQDFLSYNPAPAPAQLPKHTMYITKTNIRYGAR